MTRRLILLLMAAVLSGVSLSTGRAVDAENRVTLAPVQAVGIRVDTLLLGGFAAGAFTDALDAIASDLSIQERALVSQHLNRIFRDVLPAGGLGQAGRLRVAYERATRADGSTRSIRVLGAEAAVGGRIHTAIYFEKDGNPGYFDGFGRPLERGGWHGPLIDARISSPFGTNRMHPILNRVLPHTGVDFAAPTGAPVYATADGIVSSAGDRGGYGLMVELQHPNGYSTRYAHLSRIGSDVAPSRMVQQGDVIGYVGATGLATGPHLHYEVRRRGQPVDPMRVAVDAGTVDSEARWPLERNQISMLLSQTPTVVRARASM